MIYQNSRFSIFEIWKFFIKFSELKYQVQYAQAANSGTIYTDQNNQEIELVECIQTKSERSDNDGFQQVFMTTNSGNNSAMVSFTKIDF